MSDRKSKPVFSGVLMYFPDALLAIAEHSKRGNDKHNPGQPLHWAKEKSTDQADCIARHLIDIGPNWDAVDPETGSLHAAALAWRALALLQTVLERRNRATTEIGLPGTYKITLPGTGMIIGPCGGTGGGHCQTKLPPEYVPLEAEYLAEIHCTDGAPPTTDKRGR